MTYLRAKHPVVWAFVLTIMVYVCIKFMLLFLGLLLATPQAVPVPKTVEMNIEHQARESSEAYEEEQRQQSYAASGAPQPTSQFKP